MIQISKTIKVTGVSPFQYNWISSNPCLTFSSPSGTQSSSFITTVLTYQDSGCIDTTDVQLKVTDAKGCSSTVSVDVQNPCSAFQVHPLQLNIDTVGGKTRLTYIANVSGNPTFNYNWVYDANAFIQPPDSDPNSGKLILLENLAIPVNYQALVSLYVVDSKGCSGSTTHQYTFCTPIAQSASYYVCRAKGTHPTILSMRKISVTPCNRGTTDWNTLSFVLPAGVTASLETFVGSDAFIGISIDPNIFQQSLTNFDIQWTVKSGNITSSIGTIHINILECESSNISILPFSYTFPCSTTVPTTFTVDLDNPLFPYVNSDCPIDWTSFTFVAQPGQTLVNATQLTIPAGSVSLNMDHEIVYNYTTSTTNTQTVAWKVKNECGVWSNTAYFIFIHQCIPAPVAVNDTACTSCDEQITIDVLANDTGTINSGTLVITVGPTHGTATVLNGKIVFTPELGWSGTQTIQYQVSGFDPNTASNSATVTITIVCAGESQSTLTCN